MNLPESSRSGSFSCLDRAQRDRRYRVNSRLVLPLFGVIIADQPMVRDFKSCFCRQFHCRPEDFAPKVFWRCLHRRVLPFAKLILVLNPEFFSADFSLIEDAGGATDENILRAAIVAFYRYTGHKRNYLHNQLRFRVSGRRLLDLAATCWEEAANHDDGR